MLPHFYMPPRPARRRESFYSSTHQGLDRGHKREELGPIDFKDAIGNAISLHYSQFSGQHRIVLIDSGLNLAKLTPKMDIFNFSLLACKTQQLPC